MSRIDHPRQQFSFDSMLAYVVDIKHLEIHVSFDGLEESDKEWQLKELCAKLANAVKRSSDHLLHLDIHLSELITGVLKQNSSTIHSEHTTSNKVLVSEANRLLSQFPKHLGGHLRCP